MSELENFRNEVKELKKEYEKGLEETNLFLEVITNDKSELAFFRRGQQRMIKQTIKDLEELLK